MMMQQVQVQFMMQQQMQACQAMMMQQQVQAQMQQTQQQGGTAAGQGGMHLPQLSPQQIQEQMMRAQMLYAQLAGTTQAAMHPAAPPGAPVHQGAKFAGGGARPQAQPESPPSQQPQPGHAAIQRKGSDLNESFSQDPDWKPPFQ